MVFCCVEKQKKGKKNKKDYEELPNDEANEKEEGNKYFNPNGPLHLKSKHPLWKILEKCSTGWSVNFKCIYIPCDIWLKEGVNISLRSTN